MLALILEVVSRTRRKHRISYIFRGFVSKHFDSFLSATRVSSTRVCKKMTCVIDIYPIHKSYAQHLYALVISFGKCSNIPPPSLSLSLSSVESKIHLSWWRGNSGGKNREIASFSQTVEIVRLGKRNFAWCAIVSGYWQFYAK